MKLSNLTQEIQSAQSTIFNMVKSFEEETQLKKMAHSKTANDYQKKIGELVKKIRSQSVDLDVLMNLGERVQHHLTDLTTQKVQLEMELYKLVSVEKQIKLIGSDSLATFRESGEMIRHKKHLLLDVEEKLAAALKENVLLRTRIQGAEKEKMKNNLNLTQLRIDLGGLEREFAAELQKSADTVHLEVLKREQ